MEPDRPDQGVVTGEGEPPRPAASSRVCAARVWPLVALGFTTISLAASAFRVVESSIGSGDQTFTAISLDPNARHCPMPPVDSAADEIGLIPHPEVTDSDDPPPARPCPSVIIHPPPSPEPTPVLIAYSDPAIGSGPKTAKDVKSTVKPPPAPTPVPPPLAKSKSDSRRIMVRDSHGNRLVTRVYGQDGDRVAVLLPDGSIGWPDGLTYTDAPFVAETIPELDQRLTAKEFAGFKSIETPHYLVLYQGSKSLAQRSALMLENLYAHLTNLFNKRKVPVHEAEFPLVAIIFETEDAFRKHQHVATDVQAYYEILSNRIFLYETSKRDLTSPEVSALQKPQTVAHEGTHQILQNIGVQPRLSIWPLWVVEGLAEYCATPKVGKNGVAAWSGLGQPNLPHLATIRDLDDPYSVQVLGDRGPTLRRKPGQSIAEYIVTRTDLSPTDYALAWALTHHLALKRPEEFLDFIREMSSVPPLQKRSPEDDLKSFKAAFGNDLAKMDAAVLHHVRKMKQIDALPYFAVVFQQLQPGGGMTRRAMVSQSQAMVRQFIENSTSPRGGEPHWQVVPHPTKARALMTAQQWVGGG